MVSFHILLLDRAGNNLVNADFSLYLGHIFAVKHIYLTLYIVHICCVAPIYSVPAGSHACSLRSLWPSYLRPDRFQPLAVPAARCARCGRVRPPARACAWARAWPACFRWLRHFIRLYGSFSRRALARCASRKLFCDRFQAVDICPTVVHGGG